MPSASGRGGSLGAAFTAALAPLSLGAPRSSYKAKSPRAQFRQLERTAAGRRAMDAAGVGGNRRTRLAWAAGDREPSKANQRAIGEAYAAMQKGGVPEWVKRGTMKIYGVVRIGQDSRDRGSGRTSALLVSLGTERSNWPPVEAALIAGDHDATEAAVITHLIEADLGEQTEPWEFPGSAYTVEIEG